MEQQMTMIDLCEDLKEKDDIDLVIEELERRFKASHERYPEKPWIMFLGEVFGWYHGYSCKIGKYDFIDFSPGWVTMWQIDGDKVSIPRHRIEIRMERGI